MNDHIVNTSDAAFEADVIQSDLPVLLDFWAPRCGPCLAIAPLLDDLAAEYAGRIKVVKLNIDDHPQIRDRYGIRGIPTLFLMKEGEIVDRNLGLSRTRLRVSLDDLLEA